MNKDQSCEICGVDQELFGCFCHRAFDLATTTPAPAREPHTLSEDFRHFLAYMGYAGQTQFTLDEMQLAYRHGAERQSVLMSTESMGSSTFEVSLSIPDEPDALSLMTNEQALQSFERWKERGRK